MAVVALHHTFIYSMVKGFGEIGLGRGMTPVAQLGLVLNQQELFTLGVMGRVAVKAPDVAAGVRGLRKVRLHMIFAVTG